MIPKVLDGAKVLYYTSNHETNDFGLVKFEEDNIRITGLVIAKYDEEENYYIFTCNQKWEVIGDTMHDSIDKAIEFAKEYYKLQPEVWNEIIES